MASQRLARLKQQSFNRAASGRLGCAAMLACGLGLVLMPAQAAEPADVAATRVGDFNARYHETDGGATVRERLTDVAKRQQIPDAAMVDLLWIYGYEFDLEQQAHRGDSFKVLLGSEGADQAALLAAQLDFGGEVHKLFRFKSSDGAVDYYDDAGHSWRTQLKRKPLAEGIMRSTFGPHQHPILGTVRMHTGVDWEAKYGTPVYAAGDGEVEIASWQSGDGKEIRLRNADGFETGYAHLQKFAPGIRLGARVHQGQIIGLVGSTGVSSGPHLHYEVLIDGRYVDPLRVDLPPARVLSGDALDEFTRERERLDEQLRQSPAQNLIDSAQPL